VSLPQVNPASLALLLLIFGLVMFDVIEQRKGNRRALLVEILVFLVGAFFVVFPERATALAHMVGIGRGVDFLLYPIVIWLTRESLLSRRRRQKDGERITELTRALAIVTARTLEADADSERYSSGAKPRQSSADSASLTT